MILDHVLLRHVEVEHGLLLVTEYCRGRHPDHEGFNTFSWSDLYPNALSPSLRVYSLEKATKDAAYDERPMLQRLVGRWIIDGQDLGLAPELNAPRRSRHQRPRHRDMDSYPWVASNVASFCSVSTGRNIQVQPAGKVAYPGNMGAAKPLSGQYAETVFRNESSKVLERVGHERRRLTTHAVRLLLRLAGEEIFARSGAGREH